VTTHIDYDKAIELLKAAVEKRGTDYVYNPGGYGTCSYNAQAGRLEGKDDGPLLDENGNKNPGCIVGYALYDLGVDLNRVGSGSFRSIITFPKASDNSAMLRSDEDITFSFEATFAFERAQRSQDDGATWGKALEAAINEGQD
jgi:hypothetical protein